jgi:hypothetical protein
MTFTASRPFMTLGEQDIGLFSTLPEFTLAQAGTFLRMSERHLNDLLDAGEIKSRLVGNERMVLRDSLLAFEQERERLRTALDTIVQDSQEMGLYDD